jgi:hypothetical protein
MPGTSSRCARSRRRLEILAGLVASFALVTSAQAQLTIELASNTALEQRGRQQLERLLQTYDLSPWLFTRAVRIESHVIPHSHPVLTLNTRYLDNDTAQVATFIHEQLHWFLVERDAPTDSALAELRRMFPKVPGKPPEGAQDEESTYLHLLVCTLELAGTSHVFGEAAARRALEGWRHYTWVYRQVLDRTDSLKRVLRAHGLVVKSGTASHGDTARSPGQRR